MRATVGASGDHGEEGRHVGDSRLILRGRHVVGDPGTWPGCRGFPRSANPSAFFIPHVLKGSDILTKCKRRGRLDLRAGLPRRFSSVYRPWPSHFCFIGWALTSGKVEPLGGAFSTCCLFCRSRVCSRPPSLA